MKSYAFLGLAGLSLLTIACNEHKLPAQWEEAAVSSSSVEVSSSSVVFGTMTDKNGNPHQTVRIGDLEWTTQNLEYLVRSDSGIVCPDSNATTKCEGGAFFRHQTAQTVCPAPWRLPSDADWRQLVIAAGSQVRSNCRNDQIPADLRNSEPYRRFPSDTLVGGCNEVAGSILKAKSGWEVGNGQDGVFFKGLPEGYFDLSLEYLQVDEYGYFWSADAIEVPLYANDSTAASSWYLTKSKAMVHESNDPEVWMSVRCVRNP
jgi:uncharacterized protein (TIGR02145 family)